MSALIRMYFTEAMEEIVSIAIGHCLGALETLSRNVQFPHQGENALVPLPFQEGGMIQTYHVYLPIFSCCEVNHHIRKCHEE